MLQRNFEITFYYKKNFQKIVRVLRILYPLYDCTALVCCGVVIGIVRRFKPETLAMNTVLPALHCSVILLLEEESHVAEDMKSLNRRDSSAGIATRYGLDGPGIESRRGQDFSHPSRPALGPSQLSIQWIPGLSRG